MSPIRVTMGRTIGRARNFFTTALAIAGFLSVSALLLAFNLQSADGSHLPLAAIWALSVSPVLPALAAFLAMDVWSEERQTGSVDLLLSVAVRERDFVVGKFLGVWLLVILSIGLSLVCSAASLWAFAPGLRLGSSLGGFLPAFAGLAVQSVLWCATAVAMSALTAHAAAAACSSIGLTIVLPRGVWAGLEAWSGAKRTAFGEMLFDAHAMDFACGAFSTGAVLLYVFLAAAMLFVASKAVLALRFAGRGGVPYRASTMFAALLALFVAAGAVSLAFRLDVKIDLPTSVATGEFSSRTRSILAETAGDVTVTCFLPRNDVRFREIGHFLRAIRREAASVGGARFDIRFVDPRWDIGISERLIRRGVAEDSIVFERGRRIVMLPLRDGYGERLCASAIRRLMTPPQRRNVYWTVGHGESSFSAYGTFGMSDIARDIVREGYRNMELDLASNQPIPGDCALIVIVGPKDDFARVELGRLESYLREGGRLLVLMSSVEKGALASLLTAWGLRPVANQPLAGVKTLSGNDVIVTEFTDHQIASPLRGSRIVLERPIAFLPSAAAETGGGVDRVEFSPVACVGSTALVAAVERGAGAGADLAIRPTRIVAVGDASFVLNGELATRANANRDLLLNCISYLSGTDAFGSCGMEADALMLGMSREDRIHQAVVCVAVIPVSVFLVLALACLRRRRRR